ncbi:sugar ABC transporter ATP-binding protein [Parvularcula oceani]|uniref:sugar ABC transporter ATP-binding protein n=1 Tax=Parvularcula oceani TaxID=1247963 RepID=UPI00056C98DC|nr:sugar ABC transporter ATP-binding protein [Parvularcula oceani]
MSVLRARKITKRYGGTTALDGVTYAVEAGKVGVLIGENGAGKSTLMKILAGIEQPTAGETLLDDRPVRMGSVRDAAAKGVKIVHQELNLCHNLSVAENVFLRQDGERSPLLNRREERERTRAILERLGVGIDPDAPVGTLPIGQQQIVEIAKALVGECRVLILDEPTSALSDTEVTNLFAVIAELKSAGVGIVYISHRLEELLRIGDTITVLRDGKVVARTEAAEASVDWIVEKMLGREGVLERHPSESGPHSPVLSVQGVSLPRDGATSAAVRGVTLDFCSGEITAVFGLLGAGRTELLELVCGARQAASGRVVLNGQDITGLPLPECARLGLLLVPEDRQRDAVFRNFAVADNITIASLARHARSGVLRRRHEDRAVREQIADLHIKVSDPKQPIHSLSGGNQQKCIIGRALASSPKMLLLDEPSRGIDIGARAEIFRLLQSIAADGLGVLFTTSDVREALAVADRIVVLAKGRVVLDVQAGDTNETELVQAANSTIRKIDLKVAG